MYYVTNEYKEQVEFGSALNPSSEIVSAVGLTLVTDGIECYGIYGTVNKINIAGSSVYIGTGKAIFVDKNHDLSYYVNGSDYINSNDYNISPGTFGYEWGGYRTDTNIIATAIGTGLSNTNSLIGMNLQPQTNGWYVVWDKIKEFRETRSSLWFLPSRDELNLIYEARTSLNNLSLNTNSGYWSSSEVSSNYAWFQLFNSSNRNNGPKDNHVKRSRLCRQF